MLKSFEFVKNLLKRFVANTFNAITVDSDQSTNDMVTIFSTKLLKLVKIFHLMIKLFKNLN